MRRTILPAIALLALTSCAATPDPGYNTVSGGATGAAAGAAIGCLATIPVGCAPGAPSVSSYPYTASLPYSSPQPPQPGYSAAPSRSYEAAPTERGYLRYDYPGAW